jgi:hypothetical protein
MTLLHLVRGSCKTRNAVYAMIHNDREQIRAGHIGCSRLQEAAHAGSDPDRR